jgi:copper chaperone
MPEEDSLCLSIEGMHCGGCVNRVTSALSKLQGVTVEQVEIGSARVRYDRGLATPAQIADSISKIGFSARPNE